MMAWLPGKSLHPGISSCRREATDGCPPPVLWLRPPFELDLSTIAEPSQIRRTQLKLAPFVATDMPSTVGDATKEPFPPALVRRKQLRRPHVTMTTATSFWANPRQRSDSGRDVNLIKPAFRRYFIGEAAIGPSGVWQFFLAS